MNRIFVSVSMALIVGMVLSACDPGEVERVELSIQVTPPAQAVEYKDDSSKEPLQIGEDPEDTRASHTAAYHLLIATVSGDDMSDVSATSDIPITEFDGGWVVEEQNLVLFTVTVGGVPPGSNRTVDAQFVTTVPSFGWNSENIWGGSAEGIEVTDGEFTEVTIEMLCLDLTVCSNP